MRFPFTHDEEAARRDKATLKAWEQGIITTRMALEELCSHNQWSLDTFTGVEDFELVRAFKGLGYDRSKGAEG